MAIDKWESDIHSWESAAKDKVSAGHRKFALDEVCPDRVQAHLNILGPESLPTYDAMRAEIAVWLAEELCNLAKQRVAGIEARSEWQDTSGDAD